MIGGVAPLSIDRERRRGQYSVHPTMATSTSSSRTTAVVQPAKPADYRYDVFISYPHEPNLMGWVQRFFGPELQSAISNQLQRKIAPRIFLDRWEIKTGEEWERRLGHALRESIYLVPVLSAAYLRSKWCMTELDAFLHRERTQRLIAADGSGGLVQPVLWVKLETLPKKIGRKQFTDLSAYAWNTQAFANSQQYLAFQQEVRAFAAQLCRAGYFKMPPAKAALNVNKRHANAQPPRNMARPRIK